MTLDQPAWLDTAVTASGAVSRSGTVVQEAGVDEDDLIKTDGRRVYTLQPLQARGSDAAVFARLGIHTLGCRRPPDRSGPVLLLTGVEAGWNSTRGLLLADDLPRLAVVAESSADPVAWPDCPPDMACITALLPYRPQTPRVHVQLMDASTARHHARAPSGCRSTAAWSARARSAACCTWWPARAAAGLRPAAHHVQRGRPQAGAGPLTWPTCCRASASTAARAQPLVAETDCWLQPANASTQVAVTTITAIDLGSPAGPAAAAASSAAPRRCTCRRPACTWPPRATTCRRWARIASRPRCAPTSTSSPSPAPAWPTAVRAACWATWAGTARTLPTA
jgi:hypothetical protein